MSPASTSTAISPCSFGARAATSRDSPPRTKAPCALDTSTSATQRAPRHSSTRRVSSPFAPLPSRHTTRTLEPACALCATSFSLASPSACEMTRALVPCSSSCERKARFCDVACERMERDRCTTGQRRQRRCCVWSYARLTGALARRGAVEACAGERGQLGEELVALHGGVERGVGRHGGVLQLPLRGEMEARRQHASCKRARTCGGLGPESADLCALPPRSSTPTRHAASSSRRSLAPVFTWTAALQARALRYAPFVVFRARLLLLELPLFRARTDVVIRSPEGSAQARLERGDDMRYRQSVTEQRAAVV
jgi:hypothetical protein